MIEYSKKNYSDEWSITSSNYEKARIYNFCISQVTGQQNILEIGAGIGISTKKLIETGAKVTSIESNIYNYKKTTERISDTMEEDVHFHDNRIEFENLASNNIVYGDFICDDKIFNDLPQKIDFDTIVCWLLGVHPLAHEESKFKERDYNKQSPSDYRYLIYQTIFQYTAKYLKPNGIISLIERTSLFQNDEKAKDDYLKEFSEDYNLESHGLFIEKYDEFEVGNFNEISGIKMKAIGEENVDIGSLKHGLSSIMVRKKVE